MDSADVVFSGKAGFYTFPPCFEFLEDLLHFLLMLCRDVLFLCRVSDPVEERHGIGFPPLVGRVVAEHVLAVNPCGAVEFAKRQIVLAGIAAGEKAQGLRSALHFAVEKRQQADAIDDRLVLHGDTGDIEHGGIHIDMADRDVRSHGLGDSARPFEQSYSACADATFFLDAGYLGNSAIVADEPEQRVVGDVESP